MTDIVILEDTSFPLRFTLTDDAGVAIVLATTVTATGSIKDEFSGSILATFNSGAVDTSAGIVGYGLSAAQATTYVATATYTDVTTRTVQNGIWDCEIEENTGTISITGGSQTMKQVTVSGDFSRLGDAGSTATIAGSTGNDGSYNCVGAVYASGTDTTTIAFAEALPNATMDGNVTLVRETRLGEGNAFASREITT